MVSQFIAQDKVRVLGELDFDWPEGTHAIGRLDNHSEGLLLLTTNKKITKLLFQSPVPHKRTYLVMVHRVVTPETAEQLSKGVVIKIKEGVDYTTTPCEVEITEPPAGLFKSGYNFNDRVPRSWLNITLTEGKYHQVRKMVQVVGHKCMRLIRTSIEDMQLGDLQPGCVREYSEEEFFRLLKLDTSSIGLIDIN